VKSRLVAATGMVSSAIGLGCMGFTGYGEADATDPLATVDLALDMGISLLDMADHYGGGGSVEELVGEAVSGRRDDALIATRGGFRFTDVGRPTRIDGDPAYLRQACDASLRRLGVDSIDLYFLAAVDPDIPIEESIGALSELVSVGKVRYIGLPATSGDVLRRAHAVHPITAVGAEYSLWERRVEDEILPVARALGIGLVACCPLVRGFLTGRVNSREEIERGEFFLNNPGVRQENLPHYRKLLRATEEIAADHDVGIARLALAWLLAQGDDIIPIPGTRRRLHVETNAYAVDIRLSADECSRLDALFPAGAVTGDPGSKEPGEQE
jgi:aryl-alcohol dehydrogenase-like predicted oxidoreductase